MIRKFKNLRDRINDPLKFSQRLSLIIVRNDESRSSDVVP